MQSNRQTTLEEMWGINKNLIEEDEDLEWNELSASHMLDFLIMSINIGDSFKNKLESIIKFINQTKVDILFVLEVHSFTEDLINLKNIFNRLGYDIMVNCENKPYNELHTFSKKSKRIPKGGIVSLIKLNIMIEKIENVINKSVIRIQIKIDNEILEIYGAYAPSSCYLISERNDWWNKLYDLFVNSEYKKILIGDLNVHLVEELDHKVDNNCPIIEGVEKILSFVIDVWREKYPDIKLASFLKSGASTRIDYVLIDTNIDFSSDPFYLPWNYNLSSDHRVVGIWVENVINKVVDEENIVSEFKKINTENFKIPELQVKFKEMSELINLSPLSDLSHDSYTLINELSKLVENTFGTKIIRKNNYINKEPKYLEFLNFKINKIKKAIASYTLAKKNNTLSKAIKALDSDIELNISSPQLISEDWIRWKKDSIIALNIWIKKYRKLNRRYQKEKMDKAINQIMESELKNPKIFNRKFNRKKQIFSPMFPCRLLVNNSVITDWRIIENSLKNYWEKIFSSNRINNEFHVNAPWFKTTLIDKWRNTFQNKIDLMDEITILELKNVINSLSRGKAPGPDGLYSESWIFSCDNILKYLANIYNLCLKNANIPEEWKVSKIRLIHKGGKETPENFRPIALLSSVYKIFTALINRRVNNIIQNYNLIPEHQSGFYKGRSTASRIWVLISIINHQKLINENLHLLYLDIKKAYDSVEPDYLVETLSIMGFPIDFVNLIKNIYSNSIASIITNSGTTDPFVISKGVKQGCPLSPTLFIIFIEPLLSWLNESKLGITIKDTCHTVGGFADDLVITTSSLFNMKLALKMTNNFLNSYNMELSIDHTSKNKTAFSSFGNKETLIYEDLIGKQIEIPFISASECYKYLGIQINLDLNWDKQKIILWNSFQKQINFLCNRCLSIKQVTKILNQVILPALYYSLQFFNLSKLWAARFERKLALLLSKYLHIPEASPLHFQRDFQDGSFNLTKFKLQHLNLPILSLLRVVNSNKDEITSKIILNSLDSILANLTFPNGITNIMINPCIQERSNLSKLSWFLYDYELINKLVKLNIFSIFQLFNNGILLSFDLLKRKIRETFQRTLITNENYNYLVYTLCNSDKTLKTSIIDAINKQYTKIPLVSPYCRINDRICIFTDASEDEEDTSYSIYVDDGNIFNKSENIPFMTNNRAELFAILQTLRRLPLGLKVYIFTDSKLAVQCINNTQSLEFNKTESLDFIKEIKYLLEFYINNGGSVVIEHINSHLDIAYTNNYNDKLMKLKNKFPYDWKNIIQGNSKADFLAKNARNKSPEHKCPPSIFSSKIILISEQGEIIQSNFKRILLNRVKLADRVIYKNKKPNQNIFTKLSCYNNTKLFDSKLMKESNFKLSNTQNFLFKLRFNKLLTIDNVVKRAAKFGYTINGRYNDSSCPCCKLVDENLSHLANCPITNKFWKLNNKKLLSIINSYSIMSKHDEWNENYMPFARNILYFPMWTDSDACLHFYKNFQCDYGKLALIPENLYDVLGKYKIKKELKNNCIYECYTQIIITLQKCWNYRCKNFSQGYEH